MPFHAFTVELPSRHPPPLNFYVDFDVDPDPVLVFDADPAFYSDADPDLPPKN